MIPSCFENIVGVRGGCSEPTLKDGGFFINDVGISLNFLNDIVTADYQSGEDLLEKKTEFAINSVSNRVYTFVQNKLRTTSLVEDIRIGHFFDDKPVISGQANKYKGTRIELHNERSYLSFYLSEISLFVNTTGTINVEVWDLIQGKLIDTIVVSTTAGEISTAYPGKEYVAKSRKLNLAFVYDSTGVDSYETRLRSQGCITCNPVFKCDPYIQAVGVTGDTGGALTKSSFAQGNETGGMSMVYSVQCNHTQWLCSFANMMALPILYLTAVEILEFALLDSTRLNSKTLIDAEKTREKIGMLNSRFEDSMTNIMNNIKVPNDSLCFECNRGIRASFAM